MKRGGRILVAVTVLGLLALNTYQYVAWKRAFSDDAVIDRFHQLFVERNKGLLKNKWFGIQALQHPFDAWITQEIIFEVRPDVIVETGTLWGGSAVLWASILEHANPAGKVITIDITEALKLGLARQLPIWQRRVEFLRGSSTAPEIVAEVEKQVRGKKVMVILDSLHTKEHVLSELRAYSPFVSVGSYLIVQDTHLGEKVPFWYMAKADWWAPGPLKAVEEFIASNDKFEVDASRERLLATNNHGGFLKRVK